jgi:hypothetical protein
VKKNIIFLFTIILIQGFSYPSKVLAERQGLLWNDSASKGIGDPGFSSFFTFGTMFGIALPSDINYQYKVQNGVVIVDQSTRGIQPETLAFPSFNLGPIFDGHSLSVIVPFNVDPSSGTFGAGISLDVAKNQKFELGLSVVMLFSQYEILDSVQNNSLINGTVLPVNESQTFDKEFRGAFSFGVFISPVL